VTIPTEPAIFHITHADNIGRIVRDGVLWSDAAIISEGGAVTEVGMSTIKRRRLEELRVKCWPTDFVGEYVPFYFCPRSIMLYILYRANHPELTYRGGQGPIVHLEADLCSVIDWCEADTRRWAFSLSNAGAYYTEFRNRMEDLDQIDWSAVENPDFRSSDVREAKQAEFLVYERFPWSLVHRIGVHSEPVKQRVLAAIAGLEHRPPVVVRPDWYF
jgi:ssDNA thymidine ADP-ribosyltransferase, DarT